MSRKDMLAAGARSASYGQAGFGESDVMRNVSKDERDDTVITVDRPEVPRKKFRPLGYTILVRQAEAATPSGIIIAAESVEKELPASGEVLAVGSLVNTVNVGEIVVFGKYAGQQYTLNGEILLLMEIKEVQGIEETEVVVRYPSVCLGGVQVGMA